MKLLRTLPLLALPLLPSMLTDAFALEALRMETKLYSIRDTDLKVLKPEGLAGANADGQSLVLEGQSSLKVGDYTLDLNGASLIWKPRSADAKTANLIASPAVVFGPTGNVEIRCVAPVKYMEKLANGNYALRQLSPDSPDAPGYLFNFQVQETEGGTYKLVANCQAEVITLSEHQKIEGMDLPVGKPSTHHFQNELKLTLHKGEWEALLFRHPKPATHDMLVLLKLSKDEGKPTAGVQVHEAEAISEEDKLRSVESQVLATKTVAGHKAAEGPLAYIAFDGGYEELGDPIAGIKTPTPKLVRACLEQALASKGFVAATSSTPPKIAVTYHWGMFTELRGMRTNGGYAVHGMRIDDPNTSSSGPSSTSPIRNESCYAIVSAYDYADLAQGKKTLLWRVRARSLETASVQETIPALFQVAAPFLGRNMDYIQKVHALRVTTKDASQGTTEPSQNPVPADVAANARRLTEAEKKIIIWRRDLPLGVDETTPGLPLGK